VVNECRSAGLPAGARDGAGHGDDTDVKTETDTRMLSMIEVKLG
jgi:hypothetical protein